MNSLLLISIFLLPLQVIAGTIVPVRQEAVITGYNSEVGQTDDTPFHTATGERVHWGGVACPRAIPFGTLVQIGGEEFVCNDRTAKKNDGTYDIWFPTKEGAIRWGRVRQVIYIYGL